MNDADDPRRGRSARDVVLAVLVPACVALALHLPSLGHGFVYDDTQTIAELDSGAPVLRAYRGLTWLSYWLDHRLWGDQAVGYHLTNVMLHTAVVGLVGLLLLRTGLGAVAALMGGLVFAVHPVHVDAVASFVHRKDILPLGWLVAGLLAWMRAGRSRWGVVILTLCLGLALWSKETSAAAFPIALVLLPAGLRPGAASRRLRISIAVGAVVLVGAGAIWSLGLIDPFSPARVAETHAYQLVSYRQVLAHAAAAVPRTIEVLVFPTTLVVDRGLDRTLALSSPAALGGIALLAAGLAIAAWAYRRAPLAGFALLWCLVMPVPYANLIPLTHFYFAERYLYVASFGVALAVAWAVHASARHGGRGFRRATIVVVGALVILGAARSTTRLRDWRSDRALWESARDAGVVACRVEQALARLAMRDGDAARGAAHFGRAAALVPLDSVRVALGYDGQHQRDHAIALHRSGDRSPAGAVARSLLAWFPGDATSAFIAGEASWYDGDQAAAARAFEVALLGRPDDVDLLTRLAWIRATSVDPDVRRPELARSLAERAVSVTRPARAASLRALAVAEGELEHFERAIELLDAARSRATEEGLTDLLDRIAFERRAFERGVPLTRLEAPEAP